MAVLASETAPCAVVERAVSDGAHCESMEALGGIRNTRRIFVEVSRIRPPGVEMIFHADIRNGPRSRKIACALHNQDVVRRAQDVDLGCPSGHVTCAAVAAGIDRVIENPGLPGAGVKSRDSRAQYFRWEELFGHLILLVEYPRVLNPEGKLRRSCRGHCLTVEHGTG